METHKYKEGTLIRLTATPDSPDTKQFKRWKIDGVYYMENPYELRVTKNIDDIRVEFENKVLKKTLTINSNKLAVVEGNPVACAEFIDNSGIESKNGIYTNDFDEGSSVTIEVKPNSYRYGNIPTISDSLYEFKYIGWNDGNTNKTRTFKIGAQNEYHAILQINPEVPARPEFIHDAEDKPISPINIYNIKNFRVINPNPTYNIAMVDDLWKLQNIVPTYINIMNEVYKPEKANDVAFKESRYSELVLTVNTYYKDWFTINLNAGGEIQKLIEGLKLDQPEIQTIAFYEYWIENIDWSKEKEILLKAAETNPTLVEKINSFKNKDDVRLYLLFPPYWKPNTEIKVNQSEHDAYYQLDDIVKERITKYWLENVKVEVAQEVQRQMITAACFSKPQPKK